MLRSLPSIVLLCAVGLVACKSDEAPSEPAAVGGSAGAQQDAGEPEAEAGSDAQDSGPRPATMLGARCSDDLACGEGLFCSSPYSVDWLGGGPAHGYCTRDCSQEGDSACTAIDPESFCHGPADGLRLCVRRCSPGGAGSELDFDIMKCWARQDVACTRLVSDGEPDGLWGCWPTCGDDAECPSARCDRDTGLCNPGFNVGLPLGSNCSEWSTSEGDAGQRCEGYCTDGADAGAIHTCVARCVIGDANACDFPDGFCMSADPTQNFGDLGFCLQTCTVTHDCLDEQSGLACDQESVPGIGVCNWKAPDGGADAQ